MFSYISSLKVLHEYDNFMSVLSHLNRFFIDISNLEQKTYFFPFIWNETLI